MAVVGPAQPIANPPNGNPAAISSIPFAGGLASLLDGWPATCPASTPASSRPR
ncbi:hypothetical protein NKG94_38970 [Micromonospora sp. M12]